MTFPIYVCSKSRAAGATMDQLRQCPTLPWTVVVEPDEPDLCAYIAAAGPGHVTLLPRSDQGLPYAREWVRQEALATTGGGWYWLLDDDLTGFFEVQFGRCVRVTAEYALTRAEQQFAHLPGLGQAALEFRQYAWSSAEAKPLTVDSYCDAAVAIHSGRTSWLRYDLSLRMKGDRDFTLQVLASGLHTVRTSQYAFATPKVGSNGGGMHSQYKATGMERTFVTALATKWGPARVEGQAKRDGRYDVKVHWNKVFGTGIPQR